MILLNSVLLDPCTSLPFFLLPFFFCYLLSAVVKITNHFFLILEVSPYLHAQINRLPPEVVKYFTDPDAAEPPDMALLFPFVEYALPLAYGVLGVLIFHVRTVALSFFWDEILFANNGLIFFFSMVHILSV